MDPITIALGLAQFAPMLMRYFGAGEKNVKVAETIVGIAQEVTGIKPAKEALEAIRVDPNLQLAFNQKILELSTQLETAYLEDVKDARKRDTAFLAAGTRNYRADMMVFLAIVIIISLVYLIWKQQDINEYVKGIFTLVLGRFLGYLDNIYQYEFGRTRSSSDKDQTILELSKK